MELIRTPNIINEAFREGFVKASLHVRDARNKSHFIEFVYGQNVEMKLEHITRTIGDGSRVLALTFL